jgi:RNA-directed DNA polymerase
MDQKINEKENERQCHNLAIQAREARWLDWKYRFASADIWTESMLTGLRKGIKGKKWYSLADKIWSGKSLQNAYAKVKKNKGSAGSDNQSITAFGAKLKSNIKQLHDELRNGRYRRRSIKRTEIPKPDGKKRPLGIPCVRDRVVEASIKSAIEPIFDIDFHPHSYGFRPGPGCKDALQSVRDQLDSGKLWIVDADIQGFFDNIVFDILLARVEEKISDGRVLGWIAKALETPIFDGLDRWTPQKGSPQGSILSPLLANIYLDELDWELERAGISFVRYADDFVLLCESREQAEAGLELVTRWCQTNKLNLHPGKTKLIEATKSDGFDFLGYHFRAGNHWPSDKSRKNRAATACGLNCDLKPSATMVSR